MSLRSSRPVRLAVTEAVTWARKITPKRIQKAAMIRPTPVRVTRSP